MENKKTLVLASSNKGKIREIAEMFPELNVVGYKDLGFDEEIEETGETFYENAFIKAKTVSEKIGFPALSDDSGLCVDALGGAPGIFSARYSGFGDEANIDLLLKNMQNVTERGAHFHCSAVYYDKGNVISAEGNVYGKILTEREGKGGFGYDPVFYCDELGKSFGTVSEKEKNSVSHRARAMTEMKRLLKQNGII